MHSITKSIVGLAFLMAQSDGSFKSFDEPVGKWLKDWNGGLKGEVTLNHLLNQTSGIRHETSDVLLAQHSDLSAYVRRLIVVEAPGKSFSYNNEAVQLLAEIFKRATKQSLKDFLTKRLFIPLGIETWSWPGDSAGNVKAYAGLELGLADLQKIGELILQDGLWHGREVIAKSSLDRLFATSESEISHLYRDLWWRVDSETIYAWGWMGQYMVVNRPDRMVAIRVHRSLVEHSLELRENERYGWADFPKWSKDFCKSAGVGSPAKVH